MFPNWLVRFFDRMNTFKTVLVVLVLALAVNGFLLYRQATTPTVPPIAAPPVQTTVSSEEPEETALDTTTVPEATVPLEESIPDDSSVTETPEVTVSPEEPALVERSILLEGLGEAIGGCDRGECVRVFVAEAVPGARYIGGRVDLNAGGLGRNEEVLYFEAPALGACEFAEQGYEANDGLLYTVIVVGQGSFDSERGSECIPIR